MSNINITFSSCWYNFKSKFPSELYKEWMNNMLCNVNNYYLVVYTDEIGYEFLKQYEQPKIKFIVKPYTDFYMYKHKEQWIANHDKNNLMNPYTEWHVNMLWSEKIHFVKCTQQAKYFDTEYYGWCDIGYFRNRDCDLSMRLLRDWPNSDKINILDKNCVHYGLLRNEEDYVEDLYKLVNKKTPGGVPTIPIPSFQRSIAAGFFILHEKMIPWWYVTYYKKVKCYFENDYLIKDDQIIVADCIFTEPDKFCIYKENKEEYDNWFMFQRILL